MAQFITMKVVSEDRVNNIDVFFLKKIDTVWELRSLIVKFPIQLVHMYCRASQE